MVSQTHMHTLKHALAQKHTQQSTRLLAQAVGTMYHNLSLENRQSWARKYPLEDGVYMETWTACSQPCLLEFPESKRVELKQASGPMRRNREFRFLKTEEAAAMNAGEIGRTSLHIATTWRLCGKQLWGKARTCLEGWWPLLLGLARLPCRPHTLTVSSSSRTPV